MISVRSEVQILPGPPCFRRLRISARRADRGHSSVGRAPALQAGGRRFDPVCLHQFPRGRLVSRDAEPLSFEDRWKEPQHGNVNRNGRFAPGPVAPSHVSGAGAGSWTSEDEVQVTEDAPRPAQSPQGDGWLGAASNGGNSRPCWSAREQACSCAWRLAFSLELRSSV